jgi:nucleoside-triphosphatase THEP1
MSEPARDLPGNRPVAEPPAGGFAKRPGPVAGTGLDPECTFETFVIDDGNRFAHAAAYAVAEAPAQAYSPLFIYGAPGVGKTHLLHAIGHRIQALHTGLKVRYIGSREFSRDFISTTRDGHQDAFRRQYRDMDVLLVDDIQFLADEEGTQQEFSRTFSSLHNAGRQLVIAASSNGACSPTSSRHTPVATLRSPRARVATRPVATWQIGLARPEAGVRRRRPSRCGRLRTSLVPWQLTVAPLPAAASP